jgi:hypothetical protein
MRNCAIAPVPPDSSDFEEDNMTRLKALLKALLKMTRGKAILTGVSLLALAAVIVGGIQLVGAMSNSDGGDTEMTKSVARIVWYGRIDGKETGYLCTGSVVGDDWVLTAYHCLYPTDMARPRLDWQGYTVQLWKAGVKDIKHPDYHSGLSEPPKVMADAWSGKSFAYRDVALLHVANHMPDWAKTIPAAPSWPTTGTALTEYGYGHLDSDPNGAIADTLYKSHQGAIRRTNCPSGQSWTSGHMCTSSSSSLPEHGDSGGPLLWWNNDYWQLVGSLTGDPLDGSKIRSYWSEADEDTRAWLLSWVFSQDTTAPGAPPPFGAILRDWQSGLSWQYQSDGYRHWIPDGATYICLMNNGAPFFFITAPENGVPLRTIEALPDMKGNYATCTPRSPTPTPQSTAITGPTLPTSTPGSTPPTPTPTATTAPIQHNPIDAYSNYGTTNWVGHAMCRGTPSNSLSMPGGTASQTFTIPAGVASLRSVKAQIDPDATVTAHMSLLRNGAVVATTTAAAAGDTVFNFGPIPVSAGDAMTLQISFTATYGKIITVYTVGNPGGTFTAANSCPDGAPNVSTTSTGLRAVVSGLS